MKKNILLLVGSVLILAACGSENANNELKEFNKMDSIAKANQVMEDNLNKIKNDSTINALANAIADSIEKSGKATKDPQSTAHTPTGQKEPNPAITHTLTPLPKVSNGKDQKPVNTTDKKDYN